MEQSFILTKHVKERYVERIMNKTDKLEINRYLVENEDKIIRDLNKLLEHSTLIYEGKNPKKDKWGATGRVRIFNSNSWIIIVHPDTLSVITLFKIDLGVDDENLNKVYTEKLLEKLNSSIENVKNVTDSVNEENKKHKERIDENTSRINTYRTNIKSLESANEGHKAIIESNYIKVSEAEEELYRVIDRIVSKK